jgi:hypothetical protein
MSLLEKGRDKTGGRMTGTRNKFSQCPLDDHRSPKRIYCTVAASACNSFAMLAALDRAPWRKKKRPLARMGTLPRAALGVCAWNRAVKNHALKKLSVG